MSLVCGLIQALIATRTILKLLAAHPNAGFFSLIDGVTASFVAVFHGVFPEAESRSSVIERSSVLAISVSTLLVYAIVRVMRLLSCRQTPDAT